MSSVLETRNCVPHLRTMLDLQRIQKKVSQTKTGYTLYPELRDQERRCPWCSTRQDRSTKRIPYGLECVEEMLQESRLPRWTFHRFSEIQFIVNHNSQSDGQKKKGKEWDEFAQEDHTYKLTPEERRRYKGQWYLTLYKAGKNGPMKLRSDYRAAVLMKNRLHHESGAPVEEPIHSGQQRRKQQGQEVFSEDYFSNARVDQHTGWEYRPSSTSFFVVVRIWIELEVSSLFFFLLGYLFSYSWFRLQLIAIHCGSNFRMACLHETCSSTCHFWAGTVSNHIQNKNGSRKSPRTKVVRSSKMCAQTAGNETLNEMEFTCSRVGSPNRIHRSGWRTWSSRAQTTGRFIRKPNHTFWNKPWYECPAPRVGAVLLFFPVGVFLCAFLHVFLFFFGLFFYEKDSLVFRFRVFFCLFFLVLFIFCFDLPQQ